MHRHIAPLLLFLLISGASSAGAQVVRGALLQAGSTVPIADAVVTAADSLGATLAEARANDAGRFVLAWSGAHVVRFFVRKVGVQPTASELVELPADVDTVDIELSAPLTGVQLATVRVLGARAEVHSFNEQMLRDARRNGWRVIAPERIAQERASVQTLGDLLRRLPLAGVRPPEGAEGCYFSARTGRCLSLVVDGQVLGANAFVSPNDVYFVALLTPNQGYVAYGPRASNGALLVVTRRERDEMVRREP